jgi:hypothetical protein
MITGVSASRSPVLPGRRVAAFDVAEIILATTMEDSSAG